MNGTRRWTRAISIVALASGACGGDGAATATPTPSVSSAAATETPAAEVTAEAPSPSDTAEPTALPSFFDAIIGAALSQLTLQADVGVAEGLRRITDAAGPEAQVTEADMDAVRAAGAELADDISDDVEHLPRIDRSAHPTLAALRELLDDTLPRMHGAAERIAAATTPDEAVAAMGELLDAATRFQDAQCLMDEIAESDGGSISDC